MLNMTTVISVPLTSVAELRSSGHASSSHCEGLYLGILLMEPRFFFFLYFFFLFSFFFFDGIAI